VSATPSIYKIATDDSFYLATGYAEDYVIDEPSCSVYKYSRKVATAMPIAT